MSLTALEISQSVRRTLIVQDEWCKIVDLEGIELCFVNLKYRLNDEWSRDYEKWDIFSDYLCYGLRGFNFGSRRTDLS